MDAKRELINNLKTHQDEIIQKWADAILQTPWAEGMSRDWIVERRLKFAFSLFIKFIGNPNSAELKLHLQDLIKSRVESGTPLKEIFQIARNTWHICLDSIYGYQNYQLSPGTLLIWGDVILVMMGIIADAYLKSSDEKIKSVNENLNNYIKEIQRLTVIDPMTGLYNRRKFDEIMLIEIERALRYKHPVSLLILDVDSFRNYNEKNGHSKGDNVLKEIANLAMIQLRPSDYAFRYGGEEFTILLPEIEKYKAVTVAERIRKSVEEWSFEDQECQPLGRITVSLGVAEYPTDAKSSRALINMADMALYEAKSAGRNRVCEA